LVGDRGVADMFRTWQAGDLRCRQQLRAENSGRRTPDFIA
jgi:hypothetical protein